MVRQASVTPRESHRGIQAIRDLADWLELTQTAAIAIAGVHERTFYYWLANPAVQPRLKSVDQLSRVHAFVGGLVRDLGIDAARAWMKSGDPSRLDRLRIDTGAIADVEDEALSVMRDRALRSVLNRRTQLRHRREDADEFAHAEVSLPDPMRSLYLPPFVRLRPRRCGALLEDGQRCAGPYLCEEHG